MSANTPACRIASSPSLRPEAIPSGRQRPPSTRGHRFQRRGEVELVSCICAHATGLAAKAAQKASTSGRSLMDFRLGMAGTVHVRVSQGSIREERPIVRTRDRWANEDRRRGWRRLIDGGGQSGRGLYHHLGRPDVVGFRPDAGVGLGAQDLGLLVDDGDARVLVQLGALVPARNTSCKDCSAWSIMLPLTFTWVSLSSRQFRRMTSLSALACSACT
jgi:hypothetical protein